MYDEEKNILEQVRKIPYPEFKIFYPNKRYAKAIYDDLAGENGELTAITQYIYEHLAGDESLSSILLGIAIDEMKHLNFVGDIIKKLGLNPYYISSKEKVWSAENVKYKFSCIEEMMEYNIKSEEMAIAGYRRAMMMTNNMTLRKLFERIIYDEQTHKKVFNMIKEKKN